MFLPLLQDFSSRASCLKTKLFPLILCFTFPGFLLAQQVPDAGAILREQNQANPDVSPPSAPAPSLELPQTTEPSADGPSLLVQGFEFTGNTLVSTADLKAQLADLEGEMLSIAQLQAIGDLLTGYYAAEGYLARFSVPPQEVVDGIVQFEVIEALQGEIQVTQEGERIDAERVRAFINERVQAGQYFSFGKVGEALNILNDQPGVSVSSVLQPGVSERAIDVNVTAADTPLVSYSFGLTNHATKGVGQGQLSLGVGISNLRQQFDLVRLNLTKTDGSTSFQAGYSVALGNRGLRLGADAMAMNYDLVQSEFAALQANGDTRTLGVELTYPLSRGTFKGSNISARIEQSNLEDRTVTGQTGDRRVRQLELGFTSYASVFEGWYQGVISTDIGFTIGNSDESNAAALAADAFGRDVNGTFTTINAGLTHMRAFGDNWSLASRITGQLANKNLDSSARFSLGGISGVRGYSGAEATGDEGYIASVNLTRSYAEEGSLGFFIDYGRIHVNDNASGLVLTNPNWYSLKSAGVSLNMLFGQNVSVNASLAQPIGNNPGADVFGREADGGQSGTRIWFGLSAYF